jgi:hypothetical protein
MGHISLFERMRIICLFNQLEIGCRNKYKVVSDLANNNFGIIISAKTVQTVSNPCYTLRKLKEDI